MIKIIKGENKQYIKRRIYNYGKNCVVLDADDLSVLSKKEYMKLIKIYILLNKEIYIVGKLDIEIEENLINLGSKIYELDLSNNININKELQLLNNESKKIQKERINFNVPKEYQETIDEIYNELKSIESIKLMLVTGSVNRGCVHEKWSDIDLILVFDQKIDEKLRNKIANIVSNKNVKVGTTVYSKSEFENVIVDIKTISAIYDMQREKYIPTIYKKDLFIPEISEQYLKEKTLESLPSLIHTIRRSLYPNTIINYDTLFKNLSHLMRCICWMNSMYPDSYYDVSKTFSKIFNIKEYNTEDYINARIQNDKKQIEIEEKKLLEEAKNIIDSIDILIGGDNYETGEIKNNKYCKKRIWYM